MTGTDDAERLEGGAAKCIFRSFTLENSMKKMFASVLIALVSSTALAQITPVGLWKTIDDDGKTEKSLVRITREGSVYTGRIEKLLHPTSQDPRCDKCQGAQANQPIVGLSIIENVQQSVDDPSLFDGGRILDPSEGKSYKVQLKAVDGGRKLDVRGYIGLPLLGRTQTWLRVE